MHLERALLGLCLFAAVVVAPDRAPAASLSFFGNWNCLDSGQPCRGATAPAPDATPVTARRSGLMLRIYESRFQAQAESARRGPPRDRLPIDQPPGFDGSGPAAPPMSLSRHFLPAGS